MSSRRTAPDHGAAAPSRERLVIFCRYPVPGQAKTRLIPLLGPQGAADLHRQMARHTLAQARALTAQRAVSLEVRFAGADKRLMQSWLGPDLEYRPQCEGDLGRRMAHAFQDAFHRQSERVVLVGTDCPGMDAALMRAAFRALRRHDIVLGPARDGGYYFIGLRRPAPELFDNIPWGAAEVLSRTLARVHDLGLSVLMLDTLADVDRPEDLAIWEQARRTSPARYVESLLSIIIPALNEAQRIVFLLDSLRDIPRVERIVVDGGSVDGTVRMACDAGARVCHSAAGRGRQMNVGAATAKGEILLFLHADTRLPPGFAEDARRTLAEPGVVAGAFELGIDGPGPALRIIELLANERSRRLQMPYGDQALFLTAETFRQSGGFPEIPLMEDFEFVRRLKRGGRVAIVSKAVLTSVRRWRARGVLHQTLLNQFLIGAYLMGVAPNRLARWYSCLQKN